MRYLNHAARHHPTRGSDPIDGIPIPQVAYYQIVETDYDGSGDQDFTLQYAAIDPSDTATFGLSAGNAVLAAGVYDATIRLDFGGTEVFTTGSTDELVLEIVYSVGPFFEFLDHADVRPFTSTQPLNIRVMERGWQFIVTDPFEFTLHMASPATTSRSIEQAGIYIVRVRDYDWVG